MGTAHSTVGVGSHHSLFMSMSIKFCRIQRFEWSGPRACNPSGQDHAQAVRVVRTTCRWSKFLEPHAVDPCGQEPHASGPSVRTTCEPSGRNHLQADRGVSGQACMETVRAARTCEWLRPAAGGPCRQNHTQAVRVVRTTYGMSVRSGPHAYRPSGLDQQQALEWSIPPASVWSEPRASARVIRSTRAGGPGGQDRMQAVQVSRTICRRSLWSGSHARIPSGQDHLQAVRVVRTACKLST